MSHGHMMRRKDMFMVLLVVLVLALLADDTNQIRNSITNIADSIDSRDSSNTITTATIANIDTDGDVAEIVEAAEDWQKKGDSQLKSASSALDGVDWSDCINRCISARNYYEEAEDEFEEALDGLTDAIGESDNKVMTAFLEKTQEFYSCTAEINALAIDVCESMESACLSYSRDETGKGNDFADEVEEKQLILEDKQDECAAILDNIN